jgi:hypothetical protein
VKAIWEGIVGVGLWILGFTVMVVVPILYCAVALAIVTFIIRGVLSIFR